MSRVAFVLAAGVLAAMVSVPASAAQPAVNHLGIPIAPEGGNASVHQWGGVDDAFAVNPDGDEAPVRAHRQFGPLAHDQDDQEQDQDDPGDPDTDHSDEILAI
jgi:hypothetical protein